MSIQELFQRLVGREQERDQEESSSFDEFVRDVADGRLTDEDQILDQLHSMGKSAHDLQVALEALEEWEHKGMLANN